MTKKKIIQIGDPLLRKKTRFVKDFKARQIHKIIKNLIDSMHYHNLIGIASSQIGEEYRMFITEIRETTFRNSKRDKLRIFINPKIIWFSKKKVVGYEGCGSVAYAKLFAPVKRPRKIIIESYDKRGNKLRLKATGLLSRVIQHEYDHLNGIEFTEKITDMRKVMSSGEYKKMITQKKK